MAMPKLEMVKKLPGRIYQKYRKQTNGERVYCEVWTVRYKGKDYATGETDPKKAEQFLFRLMGGTGVALAKPKPWQANLPAVALPSRNTGAKMSEVLDLFVADSEIRGLASAKGNEGIVRNYLKPFFGDVPADELTTTLLNKYKANRMGAEPKPANGTLNRELGALKRALNYAMREHQPPLLQRYPKIVMMKEATPRQGFLTHRDYMRLRHALPAHWEPLFVLAYHVGRRRGELLQIDIVDVAMNHKQPHIRIYGDATKSGTPSLLPLYGEAIDVIKRQIAATERDYPDCGLLFHHHGQPFQKNQASYRVWDTACESAGLSGLLFHDLRRTAVGMLIDAGNSREAAMKITGHKTESAFVRYHIVRAEDMTATVNRMETLMAAKEAELSKDSGTVYWPGSDSKPV